MQLSVSEMGVKWVTWSQRTRTGHLECIEVCAGECGKHHSVAVASADHTDSSTSSDCALHRATAVEDLPKTENTLMISSASSVS